MTGAKSLDFDYSLDWTLHLKVMTMTTVISGSPAKSHDYDYVMTTVMTGNKAINRGKSQKLNKEIAL